MAKARHIAAPTSRLLTPAEAADYCRVSQALFAQICRVRPLELGSARVRRFDKLDLDAWLDGLKNGQAETDDEILSRLG